MAELPKDLPEYVGKAIADLQAKASDQIRHGTDTSWAAGYFSAIADLTEQLELEGKMEETARRARIRKIVHGDAA